MVSIKQLTDSNIPSSQMTLVFESRMLWRDLVTWLQAYLASVFAGFGNQDSIEVKLKEVATKFGNVLSTVFGGEVGEQYITLINNWINTFKLLVDAQMNDDVNTVNEYTNQLYENINQISVLLSAVNPFWTESEWKALLYRFNEMMIEQLSAYLYKEYTRNIESFDRILNLTSIIGNYYSRGLLNYLAYSR
ncbi:hypothetical protein [Aminipila luticellarii]|uniref:Uncharacterized protein n=1 Tax=Aminipila luticellarii TaxID=2507160 RepID=A0A410PX26_9FIRM|nr:hypothetical protein [Aminipila luticellarii]QAT43454.1 hypothetical protein EQM06_09625 [Aminipila luticellarii]